MKQGDKVYYIENWEIKEAELLRCGGGYVTLRYQRLMPELMGGQSIYMNKGIRLRPSRIFSNEKDAQIALDRYRKTWR